MQKGFEKALLELRESAPESSLHEIEEFEESFLWNDIKTELYTWLHDLRELYEAPKHRDPETGKVTAFLESNDFYRGQVNGIKFALEVLYYLKVKKEEEHENQKS